MSYIAVGFASQDRCFRESTSYVESDVEAKRVLTAVDTALPLIEAWATCADGCHGGDHALEKAATRVLGNAVASARLALSGHYDESLMLTRAVGESANLLFLFARDPDTFQHWKIATDKERRERYSPRAVRCRLEDLADAPWMDRATYSELSGKVVHLTPESAHQVYDLDVPPNAGGLVQKNGIRRGMFELAVQVAGFMMALSEMTMVAEATRKAIGAMAKRLLFSVPGVQEADDAQQHDEPDEGSASLRLRRLS